MQMTLPFLAGMLFGILLAWWLLSAAHKNALIAYHAHGQYEPARRAVVRHFHLHGTLNLSQLERMMDISGPTALRYLDQMVHDGLIKQQGHRGSDAFYTLV